VHCHDGDGVTSEYVLEQTGAAVLVPPLVWRYLSGFSPGAVCLVMASGPYDPDEYIHHRQEFERLIAAR
jgi:hypothetical protein